jgi:hypothetical protein
MSNQNDLNFDINLSSSNNNPSSTPQNPVINSTNQQININNFNQTPSQQISSNSKPTQIDFTNFICKANNPLIVFFTLIFKVSAIVLYLILGIFGVSDALIFIIVVILSSFDFWFVKNVSGRILVGLRWWNEVKDDGSEVWIFESDNEKKATSIDTTIFWGSVYLAPAFWIVFVIINLLGLKLMWFLVCLIAFFLTFSNTMGYYKCSGEQKKKLTSFLANKGQEGFTKILSYGASAMTSNNNNNDGNKV